MDKKTRAKEKLARIPIKINNTIPPLKKPKWLKTKLPSIEKIQEIDQLIKSKSLVTVCEEASCPNLPECYSRGTATFMILGNKCTRRCSFCDVAHGKPDPIDKSEPKNLADAIEKMNLKYAVITSVDRDDLLDGGSEHFLNCVNEIKKKQKYL
jgi:lipoic acid synthetase